MTNSTPRSNIAVLAIGAVIGGIVGAVIAVNVMIYAGPHNGYEAGIGDIFDHNALTGLATVAALFAGPFIGILIASKSRTRRPHSD